MNNNYGATNVNQSFGGFTSKNDTTKQHNQSSTYGYGDSPHKQAKPAPAGILNSKTLAEENLKGFRLRNLQKESDLPLRVN